MKQAVKKFNNLIKKTIFKVQNKTNNNFKISSFNKILITLISLLFIYLFYLSIPILYDKTWVQTNTESKLLDDYKIILSNSSDISYRILPAPHFLIKDSKILLDISGKIQTLADIKKLKIFISQNNFLDKEKINIKKVVIDNANFLLNREKFNLLNHVSNSQFSNKKIKINNSNIFFKNSLGETISIIRMSKSFLFFDDGKLLNMFNISGEVFNVPFTFNFENSIDSRLGKKIKINAQNLNLNITNKSNKTNKNFTSGTNTISIFNSKINTKYDIKEKLLIFTSNNSRINNSKIDYSGILSINPFDLNLDINLGNYKISKLFYPNSILFELIKSELLFNENISVNTSIIATSNKNNEIFDNAKINFSIINGKINFDNTKFVNDKIGLIELNNSNLFFENNKLVLNTNILIDIKNSNALFSFLNTSKKSRKNIQNILINLDYVFLSNQIKFNSVRIDNNIVSDKFLSKIDSFRDNNFNNLTKSRRLINELLNVYDG